MKHRALIFFFCGILAFFMNGCTNEEVSYASDTDENPTLSLQLTDEIIEAIQYIEAHAVLPERADKISEYQRFYAVFDEKGKHGAFKSPGNKQDHDIIAIYVQNLRHGGYFKNAVQVDGKNGAFFTDIERLPVISDGGCSVISLWFNIDKRTFFKLSDLKAEIPELKESKHYDGMCNGLA